MKIGVLGNGTIAVECCRILMEHGHKPAFIIGDWNDDGNDGWQKSLRKFANENKIWFSQPSEINKEDWYGFFKKEAVDILLSFQYRFILKEPIISSAKHTANLHFAPLPKYRGMYPVAWALLDGEKEFGVTLHIIKAGIDNGDILSQELFPIEDSDTAETLYKKAVEHGVNLFQKSCKKLLTFKLKPTPQDETKASYHPTGSIDFSKTEIDWTKSNDEIFHFTRALIFPQFQLPTTTLRDRKVRITDVRKLVSGGLSFTYEAIK